MRIPPDDSAAKAERKIPAAPEAEAMLLTSVVAEPAHYDCAVEAGVVFGSFSVPEHANLWGAMQSLRADGREIEPTSIKSLMESRNAWGYIAHDIVANACGDNALLMRNKFYATLPDVLAAHQRRELIRLGTWAADAAFAGGEPSAIAERLVAISGAAQTPNDALRLLDMKSMREHREPQPWLCDGIIPLGAATLLASHGGIGKSGLMLQLAAAVSVGLEFLRFRGEPAEVIFFSGEDSDRTIFTRLNRMGDAWGVNVFERLHVVDAQDNPTLYASPDRYSPGAVTRRFMRLQKLAEQKKPKLIVIDNASDVFDADENCRREVRAFVRAIGKLAAKADAAVVLLAHIKKAAAVADDGQGFSGSTAWHNSCRSRLALIGGEDGQLELRHQKSNFGAIQESSWLMYDAPSGLFTERMPGPFAAGSGTIPPAAILAVLQKVIAIGRVIPANMAAPVGAFAVCRAHPDFPKTLKRRDFDALIMRLESDGFIRQESFQKSRKHHATEIWQITPAGELALGTAGK